MFPSTHPPISKSSVTTNPLPILPLPAQAPPSPPPPSPSPSPQPSPSPSPSPQPSPPPSPQLSPSPTPQPHSPQPSPSPPPVNTHAMVTRSKRGIFKLKGFVVEPVSAVTCAGLGYFVVQQHEVYIVQHGDLPSLPTSDEEALAHPGWCSAMDKEIQALNVKGTWTLIPPSPLYKVISNKWVYRVKTLSNGELDKLKARLVARGFELLAGVDFLEIFSPVVKTSTIRLIFTLAASKGWTIQQIDVNNTFLNGDLDDNIYMSQPKGFEDPCHQDYVCKLQKSLYGLRQTPRAWNDKLRTCLYGLGFKRSTSDFSLFHKQENGELFLILIYVDDILITGDNKDAVLGVITLLNKEFALTSFGEVHYFLGIEVAKVQPTYSLCQIKYIQELLQKTKMTDCHPCSTPITPATKLSKEGGLPFSDLSLYRSTVGALQYLTHTRPNIAFVVNKLSQFLQNPTSLHWAACKRVLRYLKGTITLALHFKPSSSSCLVGFADADYASCIDDRRSTGGHCVYFGENLVTWSSKKQHVVSRSSTESEYRALANATTEVIWLDSLCHELGLSVSYPHKIWCDNSSVVALSSNPVFHARTKHIEVDVHFVREKVQDKFVEIGHVPAEDQVADLFTKPLAEPRFCHLRSKLLLALVRDHG